MYSVLSLSKLESLDLFDNNLSSFSCLKGDLSSLVYLNLCYNNFSGFPYELSTLPNLKRMRIWGNNIQKITSMIKYFVNLVEMNLDFNKLESISEEIKNCNSLKILTLEGNYLTSEEFTKICNVETLEKLNLKRNPINKIPRRIRRLRNLRELNLSKTSINILPRQLIRLPKLEQLGIGGIKMNDWGVAFEILSQIPSLKRIGMYSMGKKKMPEGFEKLQQIEIFWLTLNQFDNSERKRIHNLVPNAELVFD